MGLFGILIRSKLKLTWDEVVKSAGRKGPCAARFLYDIVRDKVITVPKNKNHHNVVARLLKVALRDLDKEFTAQAVSKFIPFIVEIDENQQIKSLMTGYSTLGTGHKFGHEKKDLRKAHSEAFRFVYRSDIKRNDSFREVLTYKYAL